ncbi:hypothetical protein A1704_03860 [Chryseobacterium cucumeris]|uniref:hypothetical protein n=1 Tax=Chryseobacterium cucumeris TaxID=1813611 RepID=UPI00078841BA|nr:hypothetical protein [Chryseobacterium cucumeris]KYH07811.1 hypothetical protein A1704_03860 [Chryseobacterium cucumeris]
MRISNVKNNKGVQTGLFIPIEELSELKDNLKENSQMRFLLEDLMEKWQEENMVINTMMPEGRTIRETHDKSIKTTESLYREAFAKGVSLHYKDGRCAAEREFISANPDGSEDLVAFDADNRKYFFIKQLLPAGKGRWAYVNDKN